MKRNNLAWRSLLAATAAVAMSMSLNATSAWGQVPVNNNDGHALDANNQVGSGGYNNAPAPSTAVTGNQIVTGNVTGGFAFRGPVVDGVNLGVGYTNPTAFRGIVPGMAVDQFVQNSTGVPTEANPTLSSSNYARGPQPFYGESQNGTAPLGYTVVPGGTGFVPTPSNAMTSPNLADTRLGNPGMAPGSYSALPKPGEVLLPGPVDPTAAPSVYSASPLYGVQQWQTSAAGQSQTNAMPPANSMFSGPRDPATSLYIAQNQATLIRQQLLASTASGAAAPANQSPSGLLQPLTPTGPASGQPLQPLQPSPGGVTQVPPQSVSPMAGQVSTGESTRQYLGPMDLPPATAQSAQYAELRRRMDVYNSAHPQTDEEANRQFRQLLKERRALTASSDASTPNTPAAPLPGGALAPGADTNTNAPTPPAPAPLQMDSLATGVKSSALSDLLRQGEDLIQHQQYDEAIRVFDSAERAVPNDPLVLLGRAEAELGGSYYRQAELDLRAAFHQDSAVLLAQYDLQKYLGQDRLQFINTSLQQIATESPENTTSVFLLAYVAYNTHQEAKAGEWLDETAKRTNGTDETVVLLKRYWNFKSEPSTQPDMLTK